jgi:hypothetical protein
MRARRTGGDVAIEIDGETPVELDAESQPNGRCVTIGRSE